jgi:hypothetical protein
MSTLDASLFISDTVHARPVTLPDGSVHTMHFKELPAADFRKFHRAEASEDDAVHAGSMAVLIAASLCEPDGKPAMTFAKAQTLKPAAMLALFSEVMAVNGFGAKEKNA